MHGTKAGKRYAKALFDLAREGGSLELVRGDLEGLAKLVAGSEAFADFISNPLVVAEDRNAVIEKVAAAADPLTRKFLRFLDSKGRLELIEAVQAAFEVLYCEAEGILKVTVISADTLNGEQLEALKAKLGKRYDKNIDITVDVDAALIGGFKIQIGDSIEDFSIASQLQRFKRSAMSA